MSCGVIYFRRPRDMLVLTGPPVHPESDREIANIFSSFIGNKVVSGGTTATIISRELNRKIKVNMKSFDKNDRITFIVGTKINEAHQDPTMPVELEIRRNVIKSIANLLKEKYLKEVYIRYF